MLEHNNFNWKHSVAIIGLITVVVCTAAALLFTSENKQSEISNPAVTQADNDLASYDESTPDEVKDSVNEYLDRLDEQEAAAEQQAMMEVPNEATAENIDVVISQAFIAEEAGDADKAKTYAILATAFFDENPELKVPYANTFQRLLEIING